MSPADVGYASVDDEPLKSPPGSGRGKPRSRIAELRRAEESSSAPAPGNCHGTKSPARGKIARNEREQRSAERVSGRVMPAESRRNERAIRRATLRIGRAIRTAMLWTGRAIRAGATAARVRDSHGSESHAGECALGLRFARAMLRTGRALRTGATADCTCASHVRDCGRTCDSEGDSAEGRAIRREESAARSRDWGTPRCVRAHESAGVDSSSTARFGMRTRAERAHGFGLRVLRTARVVRGCRIVQRGIGVFAAPLSLRPACVASSWPSV